jgi:hypothetical protein
MYTMKIREPDLRRKQNRPKLRSPDFCRRKNTTKIRTPDSGQIKAQLRTCPPPNNEQPSWKANLSKRWPKKHTTKGDLCDSLLDTEISLAVPANNNVGQTQRIESLEHDFADLIQYINEQL